MSNDVNATPGGAPDWVVLKSIQSDIDHARQKAEQAERTLDNAGSRLEIYRERKLKQDADFTIQCPHCGKEIDPAKTPHSVIGPLTATYSCPNCPNSFEGPPPNLGDNDNEDAQ